MTVSMTENKTENTLEQPKVDTIVSQQKVDKTSTSQLQENKQTDGTSDDPNWRAFREARKKDKADRESAERRATEKEAEVAALKAAMEAAFSKSAPPSQAYQQYYATDQSPVEETEDARIEKKVQVAIAQREATNEKARLEREQRELPQRLVQAYPDYNQVVNEENGAYLEYHHPELYRSLLRQPENFETLSDTYKLVKKLIPNNSSAKKDAARADNNFNKPKSISTSSMMQPGEVSGGSAKITDEKRAENWARMQKILKGVS